MSDPAKLVVQVGNHDIAGGGKAFLIDASVIINNSNFYRGKSTPTSITITLHTSLSAWLKQRRLRIAESFARHHENIAQGAPPIRFEFLLRLLVSTNQFEDTIDSLNELYQRECARKGRKRANTWQRCQVRRLLWQWAIERTRAAIRSALRAVCC